MGGPQEVTCGTTLRPGGPHSGFTPKGNQNGIAKRSVRTCACHSLRHNSPEVETAQMSISL